MSKFAKLKSMLESKGLPASEAGGIAYKQGVKKFGKKVMSKASTEHKSASSVQKALKK
jgi:hypothetical protein